MQIKTFYFNPFRVCTYVVNDAQGNAIIIDAGCQTAREQERLVEYIAKYDLHVQAHLLTHGHLDHLMGARFIYEQYSVLPHLSDKDRFYFDRQVQQAEAFGCPMEDEPLLQYHALEDNQRLQFGDLQFQVIATPGHTAGGVCYLIDQTLFSGDTLFAGGIGRTDLPGGDYDMLMTSIYQQLLTLPDTTKVYPGHGFETTIGEERMRF